MFYVTGRISGKKPLKTGLSPKGEWKIMIFSITKRYDKKQVHWWFTAKGKKADLLLKFRIGDKVEIEFVPEHQIKGDHIFTENIVLDIHLSEKKPNWDDTNEEFEPEVEFIDDLNLQKDLDKKLIIKNGTK